MIKATPQLPPVAGNVTRVADANDGVRESVAQQIAAKNSGFQKVMTASLEASAQLAFAFESLGIEKRRALRVVPHL